MDFLYTSNSIANTKRLLLIAPETADGSLILFDNGERVRVSRDDAKQLVDAVKLSSNDPALSAGKTGVS